MEFFNVSIKMEQPLIINSGFIYTVTKKMVTII